MSRPTFTETEEKLIDHIRNREATAKQVWLYYLPWLIGATTIFFSGLYFHKPHWEVFGFVVNLGLLLRFVYYQCKRDWRVKPIVDKYENAFRQVQ